MCYIQIKNLLYIIVMGIASSKQTVVPKGKEKTYAPVSVKDENEKEQLPDNKDKKPEVHDIYEKAFLLCTS